MPTPQSTSRYYIQPMTGMVHTDPNCSVGTARYRLSPACSSDAEVEASIASGAARSCKKCGPR